MQSRHRLATSRSNLSVHLMPPSRREKCNEHCGCFCSFLCSFLCDTYEGEDTESTDGGVGLGDGDGLLELLKSGVPVELLGKNRLRRERDDLCEQSASVWMPILTATAECKKEKRTSLSICYPQNVEFGRTRARNPGESIISRECGRGQHVRRERRW